MELNMNDSYFDDMIDYSQAPSFDFFDKQYRVVALLKDSVDINFPLCNQTDFKYSTCNIEDMLRNWNCECSI